MRGNGAEWGCGGMNRFLRPSLSLAPPPLCLYTPFDVRTCPLPASLPCLTRSIYLYRYSLLSPIMVLLGNDGKFEGREGVGSPHCHTDAPRPPHTNQ